MLYYTAKRSNWPYGTIKVIMNIQIGSDEEMVLIGQTVGRRLRDSQVIELIGDVGAGKTTFTKGLASGMGITDTVQSPTFTLSRVYKASDDMELRHYDFYRINEAGVMGYEIDEASSGDKVVVVVEWSSVVEGLLPSDRLQVHIEAVSETGRSLRFVPTGPRSRAIVEGLQE